MAGVRFTTLQSRPREFLDFTSLNASNEIMRHKAMVGLLSPALRTDSQSAAAPGRGAASGSQSVHGYPPAVQQRWSADGYGSRLGRLAATS